MSCVSQMGWCQESRYIAARPKYQPKLAMPQMFFELMEDYLVQSVEVRNNNDKISIKSNIIKDYNNGMSSFDKSDQMLYYYTMRKTIRWPKKIFLHIIEMYIHNAHLLYQKATNSDIKTLKFRETFIAHLIETN